MDYKDVVNDLTTTKEQDQVTKFIKKFDEENQIRDEERKAKKDQEEGASESYEMKFLGMSIKDLPSSAKLAYVAIFSAIVIGALYYGLSNVDKKPTKNSNKRRKSPKKVDWSSYIHTNIDPSTITCHLWLSPSIIEIKILDRLPCLSASPQIQ